jgi:hypothetical protein
MSEETTSPGTSEGPIAPPQPAEDPAHPDPNPADDRDAGSKSPATPGSAESGGLDDA